jgi:hypothetical protein
VVTTDVPACEESDRRAITKTTEVDEMISNWTVSNEVAAARRAELHAEAAAHRVVQQLRRAVSRRAEQPSPRHERSYRPATA